jgi:hypothetical protein
MNNAEYINYLGKIAAICPMVLDRDTIAKEFRPHLLDENTEMLRNRAPISPNNVANECTKVLSGVPLGEHDRRSPVQRGTVPLTVLEFTSVSAQANQTVVAEVKLRTLVSYTFHSMCVSTDERLSAEPLQAAAIAKLFDQPEDLVLVNAWHVPPGVLLLTALGTRLALSLLPRNFRGRYAETSVFETKIASSAATAASFAPKSNILVVTFDAEGAGRSIALVQLALDFRSATELHRRPLAALLPLPIAGDVAFDGLVVDEAATHGVITATREGHESQHVLIDFDPMKLSLVPLVHPVIDIALPVVPLHFHGQTVVAISSGPGDDGCFLLYQFSRQPTVYSIGLNRFNEGYRCKIGVAEASRQPVLILSHDREEPRLQDFLADLPTFPRIDDMFNATIDTETIPQFVANCLKRFGLSEVERVCLPTRVCYPVELARVDVLMPGDAKGIAIRNLARGLRSVMPACIPREWEIPLVLHHFDPDKRFGRDGVLKLTMGDATTKVIVFLTRLAGLPRTMVESIPPPQQFPSIRDIAAHLVGAAATRAMSQFPPFSLLRASVNRDAAVLTLVDIGSADGSPIFSALTGVPFTRAPAGTFRLGSNFVPDFDGASDWRKADGRALNGEGVKKWHNVLAATVRPARAHLRTTNVIALYTALACSDLVVVCADDATFLVDVLQTFIQCVVQLETEFAHLFCPEYWNDPRTPLTKREPPPRIAFVTDLGAAPEMRKIEIEDAIARFLAAKNRDFVDSLFRSEMLMFIDSNTSAFEIARAIAQEQVVPLVENSWSGFHRGTAEALANVQTAAGYFAGLLSYVDGFMVTDAVDTA